jgi:EAL domain-containing protein (putative c-di-GMP-specific phosphodiesterase class I)
MPIEALKIDRSFIAAMGADRTGKSIVQAIVALAHSLDMGVIAEGVETESQLQFLKQVGCDYAQGYFFAKPLVASDIAGFVRKSIANANAA